MELSSSSEADSYSSVSINSLLYKLKDNYRVQNSPTLKPVLNKQLRIAEKWWSSSFVTGRGANHLSP